MSSVKPRMSMVTLGVSDMRRAIEFYQNGVGFPLITRSIVRQQSR